MSGKRRGGLGRGLGSLIPTAPPESVDPTTAAADQQVDAGATPSTSSPAGSPSTSDVAPERTTTAATTPSRPGPADIPNLVPVEGATFREIPVEQVHANAKQPRQVFDEDALAELTHSIREFGVLQPIVVRDDPEGGYELVMGERRLRASTAAGLTQIPAIIRSTADDDMLRDALLENIHRAQLNPLEEAAAYQQLLEEFGTTHDELARRIGRSRPQITNTIRLLNLSIAVQRRVAAGVLSAGHARALLSIDNVDTQDELASRIVAEGLSVRATEELAALARDGGNSARKPRRSSGPRITAPAVTDLADKLSDRFDTRVRVDIGRRKGRISVEFGSIDDLERIVALMAPSLVNKIVDEPAQSPESNAP